MAKAVKMTFGQSTRQFQALVKNSSASMKREIENLIQRIAREVLRDVKRFTPVKTGALKDSWKMRKRGQGPNAKYEIRSGKRYALFIEHGTKYIAPHRMLTKAVAAGERKLKAGLERIEAKMAKDFNK